MNNPISRIPHDLLKTFFLHDHNIDHCYNTVNLKLLILFTLFTTACLKSVYIIIIIIIQIIVEPLYIT
jgi:hypothetical protein